eukprot:COSAG01_NODE_58138_length_308_cov_0.119617_1_plen_51_part_01
MWGGVFSGVEWGGWGLWKVWWGVGRGGGGWWREQVVSWARWMLVLVCVDWR